MYLNMTSIEDAWGVSDLSHVDVTNPFQNTQEQTKHLHSHVIPKSSVLNHPNSIMETRPTRMDIAVYHPEVINHLYSKTPAIRTTIVTDLVRSSMLPPEPPVQTPEPTQTHTITRTQTPPVVVSAPTTIVKQDKKEYYHAMGPQTHSDISVWILITFVLLLVDKL